MKQLTTAVVAAIVTLGASAEGYQVNTFSAKQEGMGHVGVAMKLGAESQIFNPGALAFMNKTMEISGAMSGIKATANAYLPDGSKVTSSNKVSTPMNFSAAFRIYDNLYAGVTLYTPYGSSINWGKNWAGAALNQSVDLKVFDVQPTISWRVLPNLSVGAGLMIAWGSVNLNKALVSGTSLDRVAQLQYQAAKLQWDVANATHLLNPSAPAPGAEPTAPTATYGNVAPASVNLTGDSELALGFNVGVLWDINEKWNLGASFRSKMNMHVTAGNAEVEYANEAARQLLGETLDNLNYANFDASMPCPYVLTLGTSYKPIPRLELAFDLQLNGWGTYKSLDISFAGLPAFDQHLEKDYHNALTYHLGAQYNLTDRLDLRAGLMLDTSPCNNDHYNPETPGATKIEPSVGLSFRPVKGLSIDVAFMYVYGTKVKGATGQYDNFLAPVYNAGLAQYNAGVAQFNQVLGSVGMPPYQGAQLAPMNGVENFTADYQVHALIPAIGISYSF